jgi:predicted DNA-binding transcriptional regulator AlpA
VENLLKVLTRRETVELVGLSEKTWERLETVGDIPIKTRLSKGRVGFRLDHIKEWLDARREMQSARELIDDNWKTVGAAASKIVERLR